MTYANIAMDREAERQKRMSLLCAAIASYNKAVDAVLDAASARPKVENWPRILTGQP